MRLKTFTTGLMIFGGMMLIGFPFLFRMKPDADAPRKELAQFAVMSLSYVIVMFLVWVAVIICAMIVLRHTRRELQDEIKGHMQQFVEGAMRDHEKKSAASEPIMNMDKPAWDESLDNVTESDIAKGDAGSESSDT
ncbi:MAG: hypothetical protein R2688_06305 [Fimbriimonadaceae bacterium]